ncbi:MAG: hypothetical protein QM756_32075 [Polyangiaceae bacterium]
MKQFSLAGVLLAVGAASLFSACGGGEESIPGNGSDIKDPVALCKAIAAKECSRIYECFSPELLKLGGAPATEAECVTQGEELLGCPTATADKVCKGDKSWPLETGNKCIPQAEAATCDQIKTNLTNISAYAPACGQCFPF